MENIKNKLNDVLILLQEYAEKENKLKQHKLKYSRSDKGRARQKIANKRYYERHIKTGNKVGRPKKQIEVKAIDCSIGYFFKLPYLSEFFIEKYASEVKNDGKKIDMPFTHIITSTTTLYGLIKKNGNILTP